MVSSTEPREQVDIEELKAGSRTPPKSLRPCAGDAYLLFQVCKDIQFLFTNLRKTKFKPVIRTIVKKMPYKNQFLSIRQFKKIAQIILFIVVTYRTGNTY